MTTPPQPETDAQSEPEPNTQLSEYGMRLRAPDVQALRSRLDQLWGWAKSGKANYPGDGGEYYLMDAENVDGASGFTNGVLRILRECGIEVADD